MRAGNNFALFFIFETYRNQVDKVSAYSVCLSAVCCLVWPCSKGTVGTVGIIPVPVPVLYRSVQSDLSDIRDMELKMKNFKNFLQIVDCQRRINFVLPSFSYSRTLSIEFE